jgi:hypothetical protein
MYKIVLILFIGINLFSNDIKFTLNDALRIANKGGYELKNISYDIEQNRLNLKHNNNFYLPNIFFDVRVGKERKNSVVIKDSFGYIVVKNKLFNNNISILSDEFRNKIKNQKLLLKYSIKNRRITTLRLFLDASLTEYYKQYILESLAMSAIKNIKDNNYYNTGRISDLDILKSKTRMLFNSAKKLKADSDFEQSRQKLANFLNIDISKVYNIKKPNLAKYWGKAIIEEENAFKKVLRNDLFLKSKIQTLKLITTKILQLQNHFNIQVDSVLKYGIEPQLTLHDGDTRWEARIQLKIPIYDNGKKTNMLQTLLIQKEKILNKISQYKLDLKLKVSTLIATLKYYKKLKKAYEIQVDYRILYLDKARINYELDRQSDLGDSMKEMTKAEYEYAKNEYNYVISYEMLQLLIGE